MTITDIADTATRRGATLVHANDIDIAYTDMGDGPPLVLLHGALASTGPARAGSSIAHVDYLPALAKHFRVIAPDTRGSGATVHAGGPVTFDVLTADVVALIDALDLDRPMVAGFSEGAATATLVALDQPQRVRALVNHAGFDYFDSHEAIAAQIRMMIGGAPDATQADPAVAERAVAAIPPMAANFATMRADYDDAQGDGYWRVYLGQFFDRHVAAFGHTVADLANLSMPTLIITGDRDMFCDVDAACRAYRALPAGELAVLPSTGHDITPSIIDTMIDFLVRHA
jgi:pimeloyl-ACP methyl ester carboxylesterase